MSFLDILILIGGILGTWAGAELLVRGSSTLALGLGIRPLVVGITVVAFGTSSPEAMVSYMAAWRGSEGIALGNVMGSNIANIGLILGLLAVIHRVPTHWDRVKRDVFLLGVTTAIAVLLMADRDLSRFDGIILLIMLFVYVGYYVFTSHRFVQEKQAADETIADLGVAAPSSSGSLLRPTLETIAGFVILLIGAQALLSAAESLAEAFGIPDAVVGATMVAVGTSLPELAASIVAVSRGHHDIGVGNIMGSNAMNLMFVLGGAVTIRPMAVDEKTMYLMVPIMVAYSIALAISLRYGQTVSRTEGALLLGSYLAFAVVAYL